MEVENFGVLPAEARQRTQRWGGAGGAKGGWKAVWGTGSHLRRHEGAERNRRLEKHLRQRGPSPRQRRGRLRRAQLEGFTVEVTEGGASEAAFWFLICTPS